MMVPHPHDDSQDPEPTRDRATRDFQGPHGPEHEAALQALLERESGVEPSLEWSGDCQQCREELARLRELSALLDEAAADRRRTLETVRTLDTARSLRHGEDELVANFVRGKLSGAELSPRRRVQPPHEGAPRVAAPALRALPREEQLATSTAGAPRWQRAWAPWVVTAAGVALLVGWWLRSILPADAPQGRGVTLSSGQPAKIEPEGPVDSYDKFSWDVVAPSGGSLVLRIWDNSRTDSAEPLHTIRLKTDQRELRAENLWNGRGPESISWQVEALDSTAQFHDATNVVEAHLKPR
jgi:hypothetical protein